MNPIHHASRRPWQRPRRVAQSARATIPVVLAVSIAVLGGQPAAARDQQHRCVRVGPSCYPSVQAAVDAARDGDTVRIPAGRFAGGVVVTKSITLAGAGAEVTQLVGGEHVVTVGTWMAATVPTVRISGMTLRGGHAHSSPESVDFTGKPGVFAGGGGLEIAAGADFGRPQVTLVDSAVIENSARPIDSILPTPEQEPFWPHCPDGFCTAAAGLGGGIESWGDLTLVRSTVARNFSGGRVAADADGGGIQSWGDLTVRASRIDGNTTRAVAPHGRFSEGGGIFMSDQTALRLVGSTVSGNASRLVSRNPVTNPDGTTTDSLVNAGGIHVNDGSTVTVRSSHIDGNTASVDNPQGQAAVINSGLQLTISDLTLRDSTVSHNRAIARVKDIGDFGPIGGALQWCNLGTLTRLRAVGNRTVVASVGGDAGSPAAVFAGATMCNGFDPGPSTLTDSVINDNRSTAIAHGGRADVVGAGIITGSSLTLRNVLVSGNRGYARGDHGGTVQGGGIWNGAFDLPFLEGLHSNLTLDHVRVTRNRLVGAAGDDVSGGGVYTRDPITRTDTVITSNHPDQCFGCSTVPATDSPRARSVLRPRLTTSNVADYLTAVSSESRR